MSLSKKTTLTIKDYSITLSSPLKFYKNDTLDLVFNINEYGIEIKNGISTFSLMPINALNAKLLIECDGGKDFIEATAIVDNTITFRLDSKYSQYQGVGKMQIVLLDNDGCKITLPEFDYEIKESINANWDSNIQVVMKIISTENGKALTDERGNLMELIKLSELPEASSLTDTDYVMITQNGESKKVKTNLFKGTVEIVNDLTTGGIDKALSAEQGKVIKLQLDNITQRVTTIEENASGGSGLTFRDIENGEIFTVSNGIIYGQIVLSKTSTTIVEGGTDSFAVSLDKAPTNNQVVTLLKNNVDVTLSATTLTFTPANYNTAQTVTITVAEDDDYSDETYTITLTSPYVSTKTLLINITDNDETPSNIPIQSVSLDKNTHTLNVGDTVQLTPIITPSDATNQSVTWSASNSNCTVVGGLVTAVAEGECIITCTTVDGSKTTTCNITVQSQTSTTSIARATITGDSANSNWYGIVAFDITDISFSSGAVIGLKSDITFEIGSSNASSGILIFDNTITPAPWSKPSQIINYSGTLNMDNSNVGNANDKYNCLRIIQKFNAISEAFKVVIDIKEVSIDGVIIPNNKAIIGQFTNKGGIVQQVTNPKMIVEVV